MERSFRSFNQGNEPAVIPPISATVCSDDRVQVKVGVPPCGIQPGKIDAGGVGLVYGIFFDQIDLSDGIAKDGRRVACYPIVNEA